MKLFSSKYINLYLWITGIGLLVLIFLILPHNDRDVFVEALIAGAVGWNPGKYINRYLEKKFPKKEYNPLLDDEQV